MDVVVEINHVDVGNYDYYVAYDCGIFYLVNWVIKVCAVHVVYLWVGYNRNGDDVVQNDLLALVRVPQNHLASMVKVVVLYLPLTLPYSLLDLRVVN